MWPFGKRWHWTDERRWFVTEEGCGYRYEVKQAKLIRFDKQCSVKWVDICGWGEYTRLVREED